MCTFVYIRFVIGFFLLCALGTPRANNNNNNSHCNISRENVTMPRSGKNTGELLI